MQLERIRRDQPHFEELARIFHTQAVIGPAADHVMHRAGIAHRPGVDLLIGVVVAEPLHIAEVLHSGTAGALRLRANAVARRDGLAAPADGDGQPFPCDCHGAGAFPLANQGVQALAG